MRKERSILERIADHAELPDEGNPLRTITEINGDKRVLIENHRGVYQYTRERIGIRVLFGCIQVCGAELTLTHMTREKLIITGTIDSVTLLRRSGQ